MNSHTKSIRYRTCAKLVRIAPSVQKIKIAGRDTTVCRRGLHCYVIESMDPVFDAVNHWYYNYMSKKKWGIVRHRSKYNAVKMTDEPLIIFIRYTND